MGPLVRRVDHVNLVVPDPGALFATLTARLGLPVLWPPTAFPGVDAAGMPGFEIAGVGLGNVHIEAVRFERALTPGDAEASQFMICFEPCPVEEAVEELDRRGIPHVPPIPYLEEFPEAAETEIFHRVDRGPGSGPLWTWILVGGFAGASLPFFCEWNVLDIAAIRQRATEELRGREGGPLGVEGMSEIVIDATDLGAETARWGRLLDPAPIADGAWEIGDAPAIRLTEGSDDRIEALVWEVTSLDRARGFLEERRMLGIASETQLTIDRRAMQGLEIRLVERRLSDPATREA